MVPKIEAREAFSVMGVQVRLRSESADYFHVWDKAFRQCQDSLSELSTDPGFYGTYFPTDEPGWVDFLAGMAVAPGACPPEGLTAREVPGGLYAVFVCGMHTLPGAWRDIREHWLPACSEYAEDSSRASFEYYPPCSGTSETDARALLVTICVAVQPKPAT